MPPRMFVAAPVRAGPDWMITAGRIESVDWLNFGHASPAISPVISRRRMFDKGEAFSPGDQYARRGFAVPMSHARGANRTGEQRTRAQRILVKAAPCRKATRLSAQRSGTGQWTACSEGVCSRRAQSLFTRIEAMGRIGAALVKPGNVVAPGETLLSTLVSVDPVHVVFEGDERAYLGYQKMIRAGERKSERAAAGDYVSPVEVALSNETMFAHKGGIDFVDNKVNRRPARSRAACCQSRWLIHSRIVRTRPHVGAAPRNALLIHGQPCSRPGPQIVGVVGEGSTALRKDLVLGESVDGLRIVKEGLVAEDKVVVNGMRKIFFPGQPLAPREVPMTEPQAAAPAAAAPTAAPEAAKG